MKLLPYFICLSFSFLLLLLHASATASVGTIQRVTKQQILASIPPNWQENPVPFLSSPSGKYVAYLVRSQTMPGAGGFGSDFCYVQVLDTTASGAEGRSVWESECSPVSTVNTCALLFSWNGLEVFDGSNSVWHTDAKSDDRNFLETLELVDEGDMRIRDKDGELAWKASDEPRSAQRCGMPGSPGVAPALPPFAKPIGQGRSNLPFGQEGGNGGVSQPQLPQTQLPQAAELGGGPGQGQEQQGVGQTFGFGSQPLVDNSPYDSGAWKDGYCLVGVGVGLGLQVALALGLGF